MFAVREPLAFFKRQPERSLPEARKQRAHGSWKRELCTAESPVRFAESEVGRLIGLAQKEGDVRRIISRVMRRSQ